jgi:hypothetical protein
MELKTSKAGCLATCFFSIIKINIKSKWRTFVSGKASNRKFCLGKNSEIDIRIFISGFPSKDRLYLVLPN